MAYGDWDSWDGSMPGSPAGWNAGIGMFADPSQYSAYGAGFAPGAPGAGASPLPPISGSFMQSLYGYQPGGPGAGPAGAFGGPAGYTDPTGGATPYPGAISGAPGGWQPPTAMGWANTAVNGVGMLGQLGLGIANYFQAQQAFNFQKQMAMANMANAEKSYNQNYADRTWGLYGGQQEAAQRGETQQVQNQINGAQVNGSSTTANDSKETGGA